MTICLEMILIAGRYDAGGGQDPRVEEWPPHPARAFSAMRSVASDPEDLEVLRQFEQLPPPVIHASEATAGSTRAFVVTNKLEATGGNLTHPGRTSGLRERRSAHPVNPTVQFLWPNLALANQHLLERLNELAQRVPYLGRSTSTVLMHVRQIGTSEPPEGLDVFVPGTLQDFEMRVRVPYPGYTDELNALHDAGLPAWQASDGGRAAQPYRRLTVGGVRRETPTPAVLPVHSHYRDLVVLRFVDRRPDGRLTSLFTAALRSHVMSQTVDPLPLALHGHGIDGQPHVAYLGLPVCGSPHADGHLVGLAVAIPHMDEQERRHVIRGVLGVTGDARIPLRVPGIRGDVALVYRPDEPRPLAATASAWVRASRQWVTATPIVLDRYPKNGDLSAGVAHSFALAGLPEPVQVEVSTAAMTEGGVQMLPRDLPRRARGRVFCHARVTFDRPVAGPLLVGAGRYFGVGLLKPEFVEGARNHAS